METLRDFIFLGSKITADGDCSHEMKRYVHVIFLGKKNGVGYHFLGEAQTGIKIAGRNTNNLKYADDTTLMAEK